jgi:hypothetical protein
VALDVLSYLQTFGVADGWRADDVVEHVGGQGLALGRCFVQCIGLFVLVAVDMLTPRARNLRSPWMTTPYSIMLLVHLSDSKAKLRHVAYLYLTPAGDVIIVATPAPAWHHAPSQWMV